MGAPSTPLPAWKPPSCTSQLSLNITFRWTVYWVHPSSHTSSLPPLDCFGPEGLRLFSAARISLAWPQMMWVIVKTLQTVRKHEHPYQQLHIPAPWSPGMSLRKSQYRLPREEGTFSSLPIELLSFSNSLLLLLTSSIFVYMCACSVVFDSLWSHWL